jgi:hypothetical protein
MANRLYKKGKEAFATAAINWTSDNIKAVLVDSGAYTPNTTTDQFLSDITGSARIATSGNLASKTATLGVCDAADVTFTAVTGVQSEYVVIYKDTGTAGTSALIALFDTATGLPVTPNGGDITVVWNASGIFEI